MTYRTYGALIASLSVAALLLTASAAAARSGAVVVGAAPRAVAATHPNFRPLTRNALRHQHTRDFGAFWWPPVGDDSYGTAPSGEPMGEAPAAASGDVHYTTTYDVPWDWAHRYPPNVNPSDRQYVPSCTDQAVTVPGHGGAEQTVNITRCY